MGEAGYVEENADETKLRDVFRILMTVPGHRRGTFGPNERHTMVPANVITKNRSGQCEHVRMGNQTLEIVIKLCGETLGLMPLRRPCPLPNHVTKRDDKPLTG